MEQLVRDYILNNNGEWFDFYEVLTNTKVNESHLYSILEKMEMRNEIEDNSNDIDGKPRYLIFRRL